MTKPVRAVDGVRPVRNADARAGTWSRLSAPDLAGPWRTVLPARTAPARRRRGRGLPPRAPATDTPFRTEEPSTAGGRLRRTRAASRGTASAPSSPCSVGLRATAPLRGWPSKTLCRASPAGGGRGLEARAASDRCAAPAPRMERPSGGACGSLPGRHRHGKAVRPANAGSSDALWKLVFEARPAAPDGLAASSRRPAWMIARMPLRRPIGRISRATGDFHVAERADDAPALALGPNQPERSESRQAWRARLIRPVRFGLSGSCSGRPRHARRGRCRGPESSASSGERKAGQPLPPPDGPALSLPGALAAWRSPCLALSLPGGLPAGRPSLPGGASLPGGSPCPAALRPPAQ